MPAGLLLACWAGCSAAGALESAPVTSARATVSLVSDTDAVAPGTPFRVGLRLQLAPGWHTYWQNPGDAGVPPDLDLTLPPGASAGPIVWPAPQRVAEGPLMTYAYTGDLLLPVTVTPVGRGWHRPCRRTRTGWSASDICVPEEGDFRLDLPAGHRRPLGAGAAVRRIRPAGAAASPWHAVVGQDGTLLVQGPELTPATVVDAWFIPDAPGIIRDSAAQPLTVWHGGFTLALQPGKAFRADGRSVRHPRRCATAAAWRPTWRCTPRPARCRRRPPTMRLQRMLGLAFLGGLILNLMPCVFPVLAMKVVGLAGAARGRARWQAVAYTAGRAGGVRALWARPCWRRAPPARRRAGGSSSSRRCSSPPWPGCCSRSG